MKKITRALIAMLLVSACAPIALAQETTATITGQITDAAGASVPAAASVKPPTTSAVMRPHTEMLPKSPIACAVRPPIPESKTPTGASFALTRGSSR